MHRTSLTSRFLAGFQPSVLPPRGPNGLIPAGPPPARSSLPVIDPPSLCDAGPCRNYHEIRSVMDAEPGVGMPESSIHSQVGRTCYPAPGIEIELGETPVLTCSRWCPETASSEADRDNARASFLKGPSGKAFVAAVTAFEEHVARETPTPNPEHDDDEDESIHLDDDVDVGGDA